MAELTTLARPYAKAVFDAALSEKTLDDWSRMLKLLASVGQADNIQLLLEAPGLTSEQLAQSIIDVCGDEISDKGQNLIRLLADNKRLALLPEISSLYESHKAEQEKFVDVELITAFDVSEETASKLAKALKKRLKREVRLATSTDAALIGGAVIRAGDLMIDSSVRGKLAKLADSINS